MGKKGSGSRLSSTPANSMGTQNITSKPDKGIGVGAGEGIGVKDTTSTRKMAAAKGDSFRAVAIPWAVYFFNPESIFHFFVCFGWLVL